GGIAAKAEVTGAPARIGIEEDGVARTADLRLRAAAHVPDAGHARIEARVSADRQDLLPDLPASGDVLDLAADVTLSPADGVVRADLSRLAVLGDVAVLSASVEVPDRPGDGPRVVVRKAAAAVKADRVPRAPLAAFLPPIELADATIDASVEDAAVGGAAGLAVTGAVRAAVKAARVAVEVAGTRVEAGGLDATVSIPGVRLPSPPAEGTVAVAFDRLRVAGDGLDREVGAGRLDLSFEDAAVDPEAPLRTTGRARLSASAAGASISADVRKDAPDSVGFRGSVDAPRLAGVAALIPPALRRAVPFPLAGVGLKLSADGRVSGLGSSPPTVEGSARAIATGLGMTLSGRRLGLPRVEAVAKGSARGRTGRIDLAVRADRPSLDGKPLADRADLDARASSAPGAVGAAVTAKAAGPRGPLLDLAADVRHKAAGRALSFEVDARTGDLRDLAATILPRKWRNRIGWDTLRAHLTARGDLAGVVSLRDGVAPVIAASPLAVARGTQHATLSVDGLRYKASGTEVEAPRLSLDLHATQDGGRASARIVAKHPEARVAVGPRRFRLADASHDVTIRLDGPPERGRVAVEIASAIGDVEQAELPAYPIGDLALTARARVEGLSSARLDGLVIENRKGGTRLELSVAVDEPGGGAVPITVAAAKDAGIPALTRVPGRQALALEGVIEQRIDALRADPKVFAGRGTVRVPFRVESGDPSLYRVTASIQARGVDADLPAWRISVKGLTGTTPIVEEVALRPDGFALAPRPGAAAWSLVRFQDVHPFLSEGSFVVADRLRAGPLEVGPIAGNLRVVHDVVALDQVEAAWNGGTVTGQVVVETRDRSVSFRGDVTGVKPSRTDETLEANAAVRLSLKTLEASGRVTIVRIGRGHLLDLLDVADPTRKEVAVNRVRKALAFGWPESVRVRMDDGFITAGVVLGGLASAVRIDEIRGIPVAPILRKYLEPLSVKEGSP
ncbi:MAG: hypothetical protein FJ087_06820, partial [Deltaproteobacteria bacterium]|nr:hypothetical protein [Deltaproteobacteria bacterium]